MSPSSGKPFYEETRRPPAGGLFYATLVIRQCRLTRNIFAANLGPISLLRKWKRELREAVSGDFSGPGANAPSSARRGLAGVGAMQVEAQTTTTSYALLGKPQTRDR